jgi:hypothetical protein
VPSPAFDSLIEARPIGNHQDPVRTGHLHGGNPGCGSGANHSFPRAAEENNDAEGPGCLDR